MRVALVQPPPRSDFDRHWARIPGLGIAYVASSLRAAGHEIELLDGKLDHMTVDEIVDRVHDGRPDLVGITCMTVEYPRAVDIARRIKDGDADIPIVVGGAHVNAVGRQALEESDAFDFACVGEGEQLACELVEVEESDDRIMVGLQDKDPDAAGTNTTRPGDQARTPSQGRCHVKGNLADFDARLTG